MTEYARAKAAAHRPPPPSEQRARITRQKRTRMNADAVYLATRDIYLEQNPECARPGCRHQATTVHHIVKGIAGRARSLLNQNTWLGVCGIQCHEEVECMTPEQQIKLKQKTIRETIERLRR